MDKLRDKNVAIIGTGATAVQVVPQLAASAKHLYVFQRTPSAIWPRNQRATDLEWFKQMASKPGWQAERSNNFIAKITGKNPALDMVDDCWTELLSPDTRKTEGVGVDRITANGIVARGVEHPVDLIVFASGFDVGSDYWRRLGFDPVGAGGVPMSKAWKHGPATLHGTHVRGFPNLLLNTYTQGGQSVNFSFTITETARHAA